MILALAVSADAQVNLCSGVTVTDQSSHPRTPLAKPALGVPYTDPEFGVTIVRISEVATGVQDPTIKPLYSPVAAWNADESYLLTLNLHRYYELRNGTTYAFIKTLPGLVSGVPETVYWDPVDPAILYFPAASRTLKQMNVDTLQITTIKDFNSMCGTNYMYAEPHAGLPPSKRIGLMCGNLRWVYDISTDTIFGPVTRTVLSKPFVSNDGSYVFLCEAWTKPEYPGCRVYDMNWVQQRIIDSQEMGHFDVGEKANGEQTWYTVAYDGGPYGTTRGSLVTYNLDTDVAGISMGTGVITEAGGWRYPPSGTHISARAVNAPGWVWMSVIGGCNSSTYCPANEGIGTDYEGLSAPQLPTGGDLLDNEIMVVDTNTGNYCRVAHHWATGKLNTNFVQPYWAEPHVTASPSGTRAIFASDWGNGTTVDSYVIELPTYTAGTPPTITTGTPLPNGFNGVAYSQQMVAVNGTAPYSWALTSGAHCSGLSLTAGGLLSGTPDTPEICSFTLTVTDDDSRTAAKAFSLTIEGTPVNIVTTSLQNGTIGVAYSATLVAQDGTTPYAWDLSAGSMCAGLSLSAAGVISGTPTTAQTCNFTARVTDAVPNVDTQALSITVAEVGSDPSPITTKVMVGTSSVVINYFSSVGLPSEQQCQTYLLNTGHEVIDTFVGDVRDGQRAFFTGLDDGTTYNYYLQCSTLSSDQGSFTTLSTSRFPSGPTASWKYQLTPGARFVAQGATKAGVTYMDLPGGTPTTVSAACASGCTITLPLTAPLYEVYHAWLTAGDAVVATSKPVTIAVPHGN
jgi:hypothetical protein